MSEQRCHEQVDRNGTYEPCDKSATGWAWDECFGSFYPACWRHSQGAASEVVRLTRELEKRERIEQSLADEGNRLAGELYEERAKLESAERALERARGFLVAGGDLDTLTTNSEARRILDLLLAALHPTEEEPVD